ncbi:MAG TPA: hypothetical protein VHU19_11035 [Pyrinomonadaceae bacterium]|jgi:hypothetical protein|nr:hypothetical protein [Pyrinomonadaceae bacterium]
MKKNGRKQSRRREEPTLFASIRKPVAPPGHPISRAKPEDRAHPAERKSKHKSRPEENE